jgi:hypothetical protein
VPALAAGASQTYTYTITVTGAGPLLGQRAWTPTRGRPTAASGDTAVEVVTGARLDAALTVPAADVDNTGFQCAAVANTECANADADSRPRAVRHRIGVAAG